VTDSLALLGRQMLSAGSAPREHVDLPRRPAALMGSTIPGALRRDKRIGAFQKWRLANARPEPVLR
jgi:hypothetical protein